MERPLAEGIGFDIYRLTGGQRAESCPRKRMGNGGEAEPALRPVDLDNRQADTVNGYGAFIEHLINQPGKS